jgi:hypothetical protein
MIDLKIELPLKEISSKPNTTLMDYSLSDTVAQHNTSPRHSGGIFLLLKQFGKQAEQTWDFAFA